MVGAGSPVRSSRVRCYLTDFGYIFEISLVRGGGHKLFTQLLQPAFWYGGHFECEETLWISCLQSPECVRCRVK